MAEDAVLRIGNRGGGRTDLVRLGIVNDDSRVADRVVHLVVKQRRDRDRHRRKQHDESGKRCETSAPKGASHHQQDTLRTAKFVGPTFKVGPYGRTPTSTELTRSRFSNP